MAMLLIAGIGAILAGLVAIGFGIPVKEFGFGNTLIMTGTIGVCTGLVLLGLSAIVRELRGLSHLLLSEPVSIRSNFPPETDEFADESPDVLKNGPARAGRVRATDAHGDDLAEAPRRSEVARDKDNARGADDDAPAETTAEARQRRNLLFATSSRRERTAARGADSAAGSDATRSGKPEASSSSVLSEGSLTTYVDTQAWPRNEPPQRTSRGLVERAPPAEKPTVADRVPPAASRAPAVEKSTEPEEQIAPKVTVIKSGVVDGMAYSLYSDGSIEAQLPEGMMRFASIDDLRDHLDNRG